VVRCAHSGRRNILTALIIGLYLSAIGVIRKAPAFFIYQIFGLLLIGLALIGGFTVGHAIESPRTRITYYVLTTMSLVLLLWSLTSSSPHLAWVEDVQIMAALTTSFPASASSVLFYRSPSGSAFIKRLDGVWRRNRTSVRRGVVSATQPRRRRYACSTTPRRPASGTCPPSVRPTS
jgi:hypothetical protein